MLKSFYPEQCKVGGILYFLKDFHKGEVEGKSRILGYICGKTFHVGYTFYCFGIGIVDCRG